MIHPDSRTIEWMTQVAAENKFPDIALIEKSMRLFLSNPWCYRVARMYSKGEHGISKHI